MILMLGPAGTGKSVQAGLLAAELGYVSVSTGALLRSVNDDELHERMLRGELIDDATLQNVVAKTLEESHPDGAIILDGFPRTVAQADWLIDFTKQHTIVIECMLHLTIDFEIARSRLLARGRPDDTSEAIEARFKEYKDVSSKIIQHMVKAGVPIMTVNGGQSIEIVRGLVLAQMSERLKH